MLTTVNCNIEWSYEKNNAIMEPDERCIWLADCRTRKANSRMTILLTEHIRQRFLILSHRS